MSKEPITVIGEANFRNQLRRFGIKQDDRRRHMYLIGKTGMGKSVLLQNLAISDIHQGHGLCFIDPHGDPSEEILDYIPPNRLNDVVYFNPSDIDWPIAFNIFETVNPEYKHLVASGLVAVFKKLWADSWGPRLEYILRNTVLALLDFPSATLLGVTRMLVDKQYRRKVVAKITDPQVKSFWVNEFENYNDRFMVEAISPIQNKVGQFLSSSIIRNIVGQPKSTLDLPTAMNEGKIIILNLSKGKLGEDTAALLGAMMITKVQLAAMQRSSIPEEQRRDFYLYVDEFQNFATEAFATILSEARKFRLNLIIAHQYIAQMSEEVRDAVFGNVGTMVSFRVGAMDAEFLEKEFEPVFMMNDLVNIPKYTIYLKLMIDGIAARAFSAQTLPIIYPKFGLADTVIKVSRERYGRSRTEVEDRIMRWSGVQIIPVGGTAPALGSVPAASSSATAMENPAPRPQALGATHDRGFDRSDRRSSFGDRRGQGNRTDRPRRDGGRRDFGRDVAGTPRNARPPRTEQQVSSPTPVTPRVVPTSPMPAAPKTTPPSTPAPAPSNSVTKTQSESVSSMPSKPKSATQAAQPVAPSQTSVPSSSVAASSSTVQTKTPSIVSSPEDSSVTPADAAGVAGDILQTSSTSPVEVMSTPPAPQSLAQDFDDEEADQTPTVRVILPEELEKQRKAQEKAAKKGKKPVDPNRPMYKTKCDECEIPIEVPFLPDGKRPVLCQDCLPEYRSRMAKIEKQQQEEALVQGGPRGNAQKRSSSGRMHPGEPVKF